VQIDEPVYSRDQLSERMTGCNGSSCDFRDGLSVGKART